MAKVRVGDVEIAFRDKGSGIPVILIGGFTMVKESRDLRVRSLTERFRVIG